MIRIIDGKRYNTETATDVHYSDNGTHSTDFKFRSTQLYLSPKGNWFLVHTGGALSDMGNGTYGDSTIEPISEDDAFEFLQGCNCSEAVEAIEQYFPKHITDA